MHHLRSTVCHVSYSALILFLRERLQWSRAPLTGYGGSNLSPVTTAPDGSPVTSVDDEVFPVSFFNKKNGDFVDTPHARLRARMSK